MLTEWKRRSGLSDEQCAEWCELSVSAFRRQRRGQVKHARQTVKLAQLHRLVEVSWLEVAEAALKAARSLPPRP